MNWQQSLVVATGLAVVLSACGGRQVQVVGTGGDRVFGTATHRDATPLPANAELEVSIADVSPTTPAAIVAQGTIPTGGQPLPIAFALRYDDKRIVDDHTYVVKAVFKSGGRVLYTTEADTLVITRGHRREVSLVLQRVESAPAPPAAP